MKDNMKDNMKFLPDFNTVDVEAQTDMEITWISARISFY